MFLLLKIGIYDSEKSACFFSPTVHVTLKNYYCQVHEKTKVQHRRWKKTKQLFPNMKAAHAYYKFIGNLLFLISFSLIQESYKRFSSLTAKSKGIKDDSAEKKCLVLQRDMCLCKCILYIETKHTMVTSNFGGFCEMPSIELIYSRFFYIILLLLQAFHRFILS